MRLLLAILLALLPTAALAARPPAAIAAAASLRYALDEAAAAFTRRTGHKVRITYAASGSLVQQIEAGAPFQLFLSADEAHVFRLAGRGRTMDRGQPYAVGRLAFIVPENSPIRPDPELKALKTALAANRIRKFAIANPEIAPYGARATEALAHAGLLPALKPRLVLGENVGQAFQFVASRGADAGLVSLSLTTSPGFRGRHATVPASFHAPLVQRMALIRGAGPAARAFHAWLLTPEARALLARHGYGPPPAPTR